MEIHTGVGEFFPLLRDTHITRALFYAEEDLPSGPRVALLSQRLWKRRFASDPRLLGKTISLDGEAHTVIGIVGDLSAMPTYVPFSDVYVPFQIDPNASDKGGYFNVVARLKPGITLDQARARLRASSREYRAKFPDDLGPKESFTAKRFRENMVGGRPPFTAGVVGCGEPGFVDCLRQCGEPAAGARRRAVDARSRSARRSALGAEGSSVNC